MANISNNEDIMDSRDICERITELESEVTSVTMAASNLSDEQWDDLSENQRAQHIHTMAEAGNDDAVEYTTLKKIVEEIDNYGGDNAEDGVTLIRDTYFKDYAQELAEDICEMGKATDWPFRCIDWQQAARELKMDYTSLEFDGITYYYR